MGPWPSSRTTPHEDRGRPGRVEEVENATHDGLRAQKTPPPGERPGCLLDPGPQRSDRTVRHSAGEAPSLLPPSLAGAAADVVEPLLVGLPPQSVAPPEDERGGGGGEESGDGAGSGGEGAVACAAEGV